MRLFFWKWKLSLLRSGFARLGALGEEPVAVGDEQHVALRPWISHYARDLKRFAFKLSPACSPARECIDMPADPIGQRLAPACLGMRRAPRRRRARAARRRINDGYCIARPVDEQFLSGQMRLAHRRRQLPTPVNK
jgi:hypothetical protein